MDMDIAIMLYPPMAHTMPHLEVFLDIKARKVRQEYMTAAEITKDVKDEVSL